MNYLENFFSLDKMIYPFLTSIFMGLVYFIFAYLMNLAFSEPLFFIFVGAGFVIGNIVKVKVLEKQQIIEEFQLKKK